MFGQSPDEDTAKIVSWVVRGVKEVVGTLFVQFGSYGKAPFVDVKTLEEMKEFYKRK